MQVECHGVGATDIPGDLVCAVAHVLCDTARNTNATRRIVYCTKYEENNVPECRGLICGWPPESILKPNSHDTVPGIYVVCVGIPARELKSISPTQHSTPVTLPWFRTEARPRSKFQRPPSNHVVSSLCSIHHSGLITPATPSSSRSPP